VQQSGICFIDEMLGLEVRAVKCGTANAHRQRSVFRRVITANTAAILDAIVVLAHRLELNLVAEGIKAPMQLDDLGSINCDEYQRFLVSKPHPRISRRTSAGESIEDCRAVPLTSIRLDRLRLVRPGARIR